MVNDELDHKITEVIPKYDFEKVAGGYFEIHFGFDKVDPFKLSFVPFLDYRLRNDSKLFDYLNTKPKDQTVSHAIYDLYDLGFPIDEWVEDYIEMAKDSVSADLFNALMQFYIHLKNFGNDSGSLEY